LRKTNEQANGEFSAISNNKTRQRNKRLNTQAQTIQQKTKTENIPRFFPAKDIIAKRE